MALNGTAKGDNFHGTNFADEVFGFGGGDFVYGSFGADRIDGGSGSDTVEYFTSWGVFFTKGHAVNVDLERAVQSGGFAEGDVLIDVENIIGSGEDDIIRGDGEDNVLDGNGGDDIIDGRGGDDHIRADVETGLEGGAFFGGPVGNDRVDGGSGDDVMFGGKGDDTLFGGLDEDELFGGDDDDVLSGGSGNFDRLDGGDGIDTATYAESAAAVTVALDSEFGLGLGSGGDAAGDTLFSIENVIGSTFDDTLTGSSAANVLTGGNGNDTLDGRGGADTLDGRNGSDTASYAASASTVIVDLALGAGLGGDATNDTLISIENVVGSNFVDTLIGDAGANALNGAGGADTLIGARGLDTLTGGAGADRFVWRDIADSGATVATADTVVDFDPLAGDRIDLSGIDANVFAGGNQAFTFIGTAGFSGTPGEVNFVHLNGDTIIQLQTGVGGDVEMAIRIQGIVTPDAGMFVL